MLTAPKVNPDSRPVRRAKNRLASKIAGYELACKSDTKNGAKAYTKPGSSKHY
jgi:hypothetical protein